MSDRSAGFFFFSDQSTNLPAGGESASLFSADQSTVYDPPAQPAEPAIEESSIEGPLSVSVESVHQPLTFEMMEDGSERGSANLLIAVATAIR